MLFKHEDFKTKIKTHAFHIYILCSLSRGWNTHVFWDGTSLHQTCLDKWHFILSLVDAFHVVTYFHYANISYSIKAS